MLQLVVVVVYQTTPTVGRLQLVSTTTTITTTLRGRAVDLSVNNIGAFSVSATSPPGGGGGGGGTVARRPAMSHKPQVQHNRLSADASLLHSHGHHALHSGHPHQLATGSIQSSLNPQHHRFVPFVVPFFVISFSLFSLPIVVAFS